ncbi:MAG TPA: glycosyltransferase [Bryobacteraceae bacterium]|nr:glycosyltransferase [Bryobacteraceae bacterium]
MPIKLLVCVDTVGHEAGTERWVLETVRRLDRSAFEPHICCFEDSPQLRALSCATLVLPMPALFCWNGWQRVRQLRRYIREHRIDIVHTYMLKASMFGALASRGLGCAVVSSRRSTPNEATRRMAPVLRYVNRYATRVLANSDAVRQAAIGLERLSPAKVDVLYNGVDLDRYAPGAADPAVAAAIGLPPGAPVIGIVANYRPVKALPLFIETARAVAAAVPECVFLLVGRGPLQPELARLAASLGIEGRVFFTNGTLGVPECLRLMSVACLCSESEGFSNALLEYMAAGLPVVATNGGGNPEAIEDGVTGFLVRGRDPRDLAAPIVRLVQDEALRVRLGRAAMERCREQFDIREAVHRQERYYAALLAREGRVASVHD